VQELERLRAAQDPGRDERVGRRGRLVVAELGQRRRLAQRRAGAQNGRRARQGPRRRATSPETRRDLRVTRSGLCSARALESPASIARVSSCSRNGLPPVAA
jgi:hypothetical protein